MEKTQEEFDRVKLLKISNQAPSYWERNFSSYTSKLAKKLRDFKKKYRKNPVSKNRCSHPDWADHDLGEYSYCSLCGERWDR